MISHRPDVTKDEEIKHGLQADVYNFIVTAFEDYSDTDYTKDDNEWYNQAKRNNFPYTPKDGTNWTTDVRTSWAFANGKMGEVERLSNVSICLYFL